MGGKILVNVHETLDLPKLLNHDLWDRGSGPRVEPIWPCTCSENLSNLKKIFFTPIYVWEKLNDERFEQIFIILQTQQCDVNSKGNYSNLKVISKGNYFKYFKNLRNIYMMWCSMKFWLQECMKIPSQSITIDEKK